MHRIAAAVVALALWPQEGDEELRKALRDDVAGPEWIYDDLDAAVAAARRDGRPIFAVVR